MEPKTAQPATNGDDLRKAVNWVLTEDSFTALRLHGNVSVLGTASGSRTGPPEE